MRPNPQKLARSEFFRDCVGRLLTVAIAVAEAAMSDRLADRLLHVKDRINRRRETR